MNAFDKTRKGFTGWCDDCDEVFDTVWEANFHKINKKHNNIKSVEFWTMGK